MVADSLSEETLLAEDKDVKLSLSKREDDDSVEPEDSADDIEAQIQALRQRLHRAKMKEAGLKRESSPIRVGGFDGCMIDLTDAGD